MNFGIERIFETDPWNIIEKEFRPEKNKIAESVFSLANEYMGIRGMFEEGFDGDTLEGSYISGIFHKERYEYVWKRKGFPLHGNYMSNTTNWIKADIYIGKQRFSMAESEFAAYQRRLDLKTGMLSRDLVFRTKAGQETRICWQRFLSYADKHMGAVRLKIAPLNHCERITVVFSLDASKGNQLFGHHSGPPQVLDKRWDDDNNYLLVKISSTGQFYMHRMAVDTHGLENEEVKLPEDERQIARSISFIPRQEHEYCIDKIVSVWTSRDAGYPYGVIPKDSDSREIEPETEEAIINFLLDKSRENIGSYMVDGYDRLREKHEEILASAWAAVDIEISGDPLSQQGIRYCIFQLMNTYRGYDGFANIGAKGLTGEHYMGRYFWDTESYCMPCYLFLNPAAARNLIEYRYNTLDNAREIARAFDYKGAMYPWQTIDGTEDCIYWEYAYFEIHINAIIPYAIQLYTHITGDKEFLFTKGIEVLIETARFWADRASWIPQRNGYGILRVTGPDEYQQLINNNYYTNYMAKEALEYAINAIALMQKEAPGQLEKIIDKTAFDNYEITKWKDVSDKMMLPYDDEYGVFVQDDMFLSLEPKSREELDRERDIPAEEKWTIDKFLKYDLIKQPDVLLTMFLFGNRFSAEQKKRNFKFYEQRTVHGSSLSPSIHSILASEVGRFNMAYEYYLWASRLDLDNYNTNADQGLHISAMSGTWLNVVHGFGGMEINGEPLAFNPVIPDEWDSYSFRINYRNSVIRVSVDKRSASFEIVSGDSVTALVYGNELLIGSQKRSVPLPLSFVNRPRLKGVLFVFEDVIVDEEQGAQAAPGIADLLGELSTGGIESAAVSTRIDCEDALQRLGLRSHFSAIIDGGGVPESEACHERFLIAAEKLGVGAECCVAIGSRAAELEAAAAAGIKCIGIGEKLLLHNADYVLKSTGYLTLERLQMLF